MAGEGRWASADSDGDNWWGNWCRGNDSSCARGGFARGACSGAVRVGYAPGRAVGDGSSASYKNSSIHFPLIPSYMLYSQVIVPVL